MLRIPGLVLEYWQAGIGTYGSLKHAAHSEICYLAPNKSTLMDKQQCFVVYAYCLRYLSCDQVCIAIYRAQQSNAPP